MLCSSRKVLGTNLNVLLHIYRLDLDSKKSAQRYRSKVQKDCQRFFVTFGDLWFVTFNCPQTKSTLNYYKTPRCCSASAIILEVGEALKMPIGATGIADHDQDLVQGQDLVQDLLGDKEVLF